MSKKVLFGYDEWNYYDDGSLGDNTASNLIWKVEDGKMWFKSFIKQDTIWTIDYDMANKAYQAYLTRLITDE